MVNHRRAGTAGPGAAGPTAPRTSDEQTLKNMAERRRRVRRSVLVFLFVTVVIILLSVAERDHQARRGAIATCERNLLFARDELQRIFDQRGLVATTELPLPPVQVSADDPAAARLIENDLLFEMRSHYVYNCLHGQPRDGRLVGVCYCARPHDLYLQADGRHVLLFDGVTYQVRWMTEAEFRRQARELGFNLPQAR